MDKEIRKEVISLSILAIILLSFTVCTFIYVGFEVYNNKQKQLDFDNTTIKTEGIITSREIDFSTFKTNYCFILNDTTKVIVKSEYYFAFDVNDYVIIYLNNRIVRVDN